MINFVNAECVRCGSATKLRYTEANLRYQLVGTAYLLDIQIIFSGFESQMLSGLQTIMV